MRGPVPIAILDRSHELFNTPETRGMRSREAWAGEVLAAAEPRPDRIPVGLDAVRSMLGAERRVSSGAWGRNLVRVAELFELSFA